MGVCAIRIDERLIHGQVATLWPVSYTHLEQIQRARNTAEYAFAKKMYEKFAGKHQIRVSDRDVLALSMLLLSQESQNYHLKSMPEYGEFYAETLELIEYLDVYKRQHEARLTQGEQSRKAGQKVHGDGHHRVDGAPLQDGYLVCIIRAVGLHERQDADDCQQRDQGIDLSLIHI